MHCHASLRLAIIVFMAFSVSLGDLVDFSQGREPVEEAQVEDAPPGLEKRLLDPFEGGWLNVVGSAFDFKCEKGEAITQIRSTYTHKIFHRDRKWSFKCEPTFLLDGSEEISHESYESGNKGDFAFACQKGVLVGVASQKPGKRYYRSFTFHCLHVHPKNIISCHNHHFISQEMKIPKFGESSVSAGAAITGIEATASGWTVNSTTPMGCTCQPGFKGEYCLEKCVAFPCSFEESKSEPDESFNFNCPANQIVHRLAQDVGDNGKTRWAVQCRYSPMLHNNVKCSTVVDIKDDKNLKCPEDGVMTGIRYWNKHGLKYYTVYCCTGRPRHAESCRTKEIKQGQPLNPNGGNFSFALGDKYVGITALQSNFDRNKRRIWTPSVIDVSCMCPRPDEEMDWNFFVHKPSGLVLGRVWKQERNAWAVTLRVQSGNDSQLWKNVNGTIMNRHGLSLDRDTDGLIILKQPSGAASQKWKWENGRILNEKQHHYLSLFGVARAGMPLFTLQKPMSIDQNWQQQKYDGQYLCMDSCWKEPCQNNGICVKNSITGYACNCPPGFQGRNCENNVDECLPSLCQNGALCVDGANDYTCRCPNRYHGKDCDIPIDHKAKLEDIRCVDIAAQFKKSPLPMKKKIEICHWIRESVEHGVKLNTIYAGLIELGHRIESRLNVLKMIAASAKLRGRYENYPLKCIREGRFKTFAELQRLMKDAKVKAIAESIQSTIETAVLFFKSPIEGDKGIVQLLKLQGEMCGDGLCTKEDVLNIIATAVLPDAWGYDGFKLECFRRKHDIC